MELEQPIIEREEPRRRLLLVVVALIVTLLALIAWDQRPWASSSPTATGGLGMLDGATPRPGDPAPDFALETPDGERIALSQFSGKPVFLNFWATWCVFCKEEMPDMQRVQDEFGDDLVVIGVNTGESLEVGEQFARNIGITYLRLYDRDLVVTDGYRVQAMPTSYFIAPDGTITSAQFGFMIYDQMRERVIEASGDEARSFNDQ